MKYDDNTYKTLAPVKVPFDFYKSKEVDLYGIWCQFNNKELLLYPDGLIESLLKEEGILKVYAKSNGIWYSCHIYFYTITKEEFLKKSLIECKTDFCVGRCQSL